MLKTAMMPYIDYVMFVSSRVVSLVMSHARVLTLCADGGGRVHVQWEAFGNHLFLLYPLVSNVCGYTGQSSSRFPLTVRWFHMV